MTAGNLSTHLRKLEEAGYVEVTKAHERRTPVTYIALTPAGRRAFEEYRETLRSLLASRLVRRFRVLTRQRHSTPIGHAQARQRKASRSRSIPGSGFSGIRPRRRSSGTTSPATCANVPGVTA